MKRFGIVLIIMLLVSIKFHAQHLLSTDWKIKTTIQTELKETDFKTATWQNVNLLLSWERQDYSWIDGKCYLSQEFFVPKKFKNTDLCMTIDLQCEVKKIFVNGEQIGGNLPNTFWWNRGQKDTIAIPKGLVKAGTKNKVLILVSDLSYTGGVSMNHCQIHPTKNKHKSKLQIEFEKENHVFNSSDINLNLHFTTIAKANTEIVIRNDYKDTIDIKSIELKKGKGKTSINLKELNLKPGLYECMVQQFDGTYASDVKWFTVSPEKMQDNIKTVAGFDTYWEKALMELKKVTPDFRMHKVDSLSTGKRDGYVIEMQSMGNITIRGYYFVPRGSGTYPALLYLPGYSYGFQHHEQFLNNQDDVIELALCVRGHGISADVFNPGFGIPGVWGYQLCHEDSIAYRSIYMDCVRAVEFLKSRKEVNNKKIGVSGGSQGGGLTLATAALCKDDIAACAYFDPFPCNTRSNLLIRKMLNKEIRNFLDYYKNPCSFEQALKMQDLIDTKGFASKITCPTLFTTALFDDDCPPRGGIASFNKLNCDKRIKVYPNASHLDSEPYKEFMVFFKEKLGF